MSCARFELVEDVRIVHLDGCATDDLGEALSVLAAHRGPTVLDLDDVTLVGHVEAALDVLVERSEAVGLIAPRRTAREILRRSGIADRCQVYVSVADALRALAPAGQDVG